MKRPENKFLYTNMFNWYVNKLPCQTGFSPVFFFALCFVLCSLNCLFDVVVVVVFKGGACKNKMFSKYCIVITRCQDFPQTFTFSLKRLSKTVFYKDMQRLFFVKASDKFCHIRHLNNLIMSSILPYVFIFLSFYTTRLVVPFLTRRHFR